MKNLTKNIILETDSYKLSHGILYPHEITGMFAYIEARKQGHTIVPFGLQMWIKKNLLSPISKENIDEAEHFAKLHGEPFNRNIWETILTKYNGFLPVKIRAVPEGLKVPSGSPIVTIEQDGEFPELVSYLETSLQRGIWYPTTIASNDFKNWRIIKRFANESADNLNMVPFSLHDFGARGVSSSETAELGGAAHLVYFMGSDTIEGVRAANYYYNHEMAAFSVPATEHSIQCAWGPLHQIDYLNTVLDTYAKPGAIVSIVLDGYDVYRESQLLCSLKDKIIESGAIIVFRPDSGDPLEVIPRILHLQEMAFGFTKNTKGYKVINNVGIIQGDGVDHESMKQILEKITDLNYSIDNIVFGSGGGLLQKVNRDTFSFAQKSSAVKVCGKWVGISKNPVTDPGKNSKKGRVTLLRSLMNGEFLIGDLDNKTFDSEWEDVMRVVYDGNGELLIEDTLDIIRERAKK